MYDTIRYSGLFGVIYFITLIMFGTIVMMNLFLAILLGNFEKARQFWLKKKIFETFYREFQQGASLEDSIDYILGTLSNYVKEKILTEEQLIQKNVSDVPAEGNENSDNNNSLV
jgi:hypothetical protein